MSDALAWGVTSFLVTVVAMAPTVVLLRRSGMLDVPNARSSHGHPTLRGGGLACVVGFVAGSISVLHDRPGAGLVLVSVAFAAIGLRDDLRPLAAPTRLLAQVALAGAALWWIVPLAPDRPVPRAAFCVAAVVLLVGFTNVFNFMDGINGISGLHAIVIGTLTAVAADSAVGASAPVARTLGLVVAGAGAAFLVFNFRQRPVVFMGDVGSYLFGSALAGIVLLTWRSGTTIEAAAGSLVVYVADSAVTLIRRAHRGVRLFEAHREHVYQQLVQAGGSHRLVAVLVAGTSAAVGTLGLLTDHVSTAGRVALDAAALVLCGIYLASPTILGRRPVRWMSVSDG